MQTLQIKEKETQETHKETTKSFQTHKIQQKRTQTPVHGGHGRPSRDRLGAREDGGRKFSEQTLTSEKLDGIAECNTSAELGTCK